MPRTDHQSTGSRDLGLRELVSSLLSLLKPPQKAMDTAHAKLPMPSDLYNKAVDNKQTITDKWFGVVSKNRVSVPDSGTDQAAQQSHRN
ncbi:hypothetical protein NC652_018265 [Populus alba x Populus x berolinensis]|nr:hypothetical protein NC652_018265 [Populus alba x Populus x berolinensis]